VGRGGGGDDGNGDFFALFEFGGDSWGLGVGGLRCWGGDEGEVGDGVVVMGGKEVVEVGGEEINAGGVGLGVGFEPLQRS